jgi:hypothetical protein
LASDSPHSIVDLHVHSTASDGTLPPLDIIRQAALAGLKAVSITDHDTVKGVNDVLASTVPPGLGFISGIEISTASPDPFPCFGSLHLLGYGFSTDHPELIRCLETLQDARRRRNPTIIEKLNGVGVHITLEEVGRIAGDGQAGRPHIAEALMRKGYAKDIDDAFDRYLGTGKVAYVDKYRIPCAEAIALIHRAGGVAVLAHPGLIRPRTQWPVESLVAELARLGLDGIEVFYPEHSTDTTRFLQDMASRYKLIQTGGTDFHGELKPTVGIGIADGGFSVPFECFKDLKSLIDQRRALTD